MTGTGTINARGRSAPRVTGSPNANAIYEVNWDGGGGGGAGGSVVVITQNPSSPILTINAQGGDGGNTNYERAGTPPPHGPGGGGGGGVVYTSFSIANAANAVLGGIHGWTGNAAPWDSQFNSTDGSAGVINQTQAVGNYTNSISGANCLPVSLTTAKTTSTPNVVAGTTATYTITVSNVAGAGGAAGVDITDALPSGFTYASTGSVTLTGNAVRTATSNPTVGATTPTWGTFLIPGGGSVAITFSVNVNAATPPGTYQNPATATFLDPVRTTTTEH